MAQNVTVMQEHISLETDPTCRWGSMAGSGINRCSAEGDDQSRPTSCVTVISILTIQSLPLDPFKPVLIIWTKSAVDLLAVPTSVCARYVRGILTAKELVHHMRKEKK
ncbi:hypothetical protein RRG08_055797 [Elysia crispata]|uniref:Uncharacterized protein n=1 Tax=Elysia crispata TaxID=231223 RepID=A0AAE0XSE7_9GAST|nr:hypothetical protein RRG08_055797 [Elysia crispata]